MGTIFLILIIVCILFWPWISKWLRGYLARRSEDALRKMMGMPTRKEEEKIRKKREDRHTRTTSFIIFSERLHLLLLHVTDFRYLFLSR